MTEVWKIYETDQYDMFKQADGNRNITYSYKLEKAATEVGFLYQILVNEKMEIIDGQNRLEVCKRLGIPVRYEIKEGAGDKEIISLNTTNKKWTLTDHIEHFAKKGNQEYVKLAAILEKHTGRSAIVATAMGKENISGAANQIVREGNFKFQNYDKYIEFIEYVDKFAEIIQINVGEKLLPALYTLFTTEKFNGDRLINKLFETNQIERVSLINDRSKLLEILIIDVNNHHLGTTSKNYIEYTFSSDSKREIIILSENYAWAKK